MRLGIGVVLGICGICGEARAQPVNSAPTPAPVSVAIEQQPPPPPPGTEDSFTIRRPGDEPRPVAGPTKRWYGLPILLTDGIAYVLLATAITDDESTTITVPLSLPAYALGGPVTHAANGHWGRSGLSLLMRAGLPFSGVLLASGGCGRGNGDCAEGLISMAIVGMAVASLIDVTAMSWKTAEPPRAGTFEPCLTVSPDVAWLGARGAF